MGHSWTLFLYFRLFYKQLIGNIGSIKVAGDLIRTMDLWCWKRLLSQLSHNHCPSKIFIAFCVDNAKYRTTERMKE